MAQKKKEQQTREQIFLERAAKFREGANPIVFVLELHRFDGQFDMTELADMLRNGWTIASCAAVRSEGFNRDTLFYTLIRAA